jgi:hypothetical protein
MALSKTDQVVLPIVTATFLGVGGLFWAEVSGHASTEALAAEVEIRKEDDIEMKEAQKELAKAVTEHIRAADAQKARVDTLLDTLDKYIKKNGG